MAEVDNFAISAVFPHAMHGIRGAVQPLRRRVTPLVVLDMPSSLTLSPDDENVVVNRAESALLWTIGRCLRRCVNAWVSAEALHWRTFLSSETKS